MKIYKILIYWFYIIMNILKDILKDHKKIRDYDQKELIKYNSKFIKILEENNLIDMTLKGYQEIIQINTSKVNAK